MAQTDEQGSVSIVTGATGADGMCRPWNYQIFVFVDGQFAGTVSPWSMLSRNDGSAWGVEVNNVNGRPTELMVKYSRYTADDALCCPSAESFVKFDVVRQNDKSIIVPVEVTTQPTSDRSTS